MNIRVHAEVIARVQARLEAADGVELQQFLRFSDDELALLVTRELGFGMTLDPQAEQKIPAVRPQPVSIRRKKSRASHGAPQGASGVVAA